MGAMDYFALKKNVMKKLFTLPNLYVLLWALYYTQGTFIAQGSTISRVILLLFLSISVYYVFLTYFKRKSNRYFKALGWLLIMFTIYGVIGIMSGVSFDYLKLIYLSLLPTFPIYIWSKQRQITPQWIRIVFIALVVVIAYQYVSAENYIMENYTDTETSVVNVAYEVLALLPLLYFWHRRPAVQYVMLAIILAVVLSTVKRGAILIGAICAVYSLITTSRESYNKKTSWYVWLIIIAFLIIGARYVVNFYENSAYAQMRMERTRMGDSSGRDIIFSNAWKIFIDSNVFNFLFGNGAWATIRLMRIPAHNDWLEILVNQGILGAVLYLNYWLAFYKVFKNSNNNIKPILGTLVIILFLSTFFSMSYSAMTLPENLALGFALAANEKNQTID